MITGAHTMIFSKDAEADRAFLRDVLALSNVDAGGGFLIFGLPMSEVAAHDAGHGDSHELYLMCEDIEAFCSAMAAHDVAFTPTQDQGWGVLTQITLPGGSTLGVYEPRHPHPQVGAARGAKKKAARRPAKAAKRAAPRTARAGKKKTAVVGKRKATKKRR